MGGRDTDHFYLSSSTSNPKKACFNSEREGVRSKSKTENGLDLCNEHIIAITPFVWKELGDPILFPYPLFLFNQLTKSVCNFIKCHDMRLELFSFVESGFIPFLRM